MSDIFDFAVMTIFAREVLEGAIIIGQYRTLIFRCEQWPEGIDKEDALRAVTVSAGISSLVAIAVIAIVAIPLGLLSKDFDPRTSDIIEGVSKIVAAVCILQLSLKMPKWLGVYASTKAASSEDSFGAGGLTLRSIRFNVAWNIWREVAECGVFLLPFFLSGEGLKAIPLSAVVGIVVGLLCGLGIYYANKKLTSKVGLAIFASSLLLFLSTGLFSGGCHKIEQATRVTKQVWSLSGSFWSVDRLPMTVIKPFGYSNTRSVLQIVCFWAWLALGCLLHYRKYRQSQTIRAKQAAAENETETPEDDASEEFSGSSLENDDVEGQEAGVMDADSGKVTLATDNSSSDESGSNEVTMGTDDDDCYGYGAPDVQTSGRFSIAPHIRT